MRKVNNYYIFSKGFIMASDLHKDQEITAILAKLLQNGSREEIISFAESNYSLLPQLLSDPRIAIILQNKATAPKKTSDNIETLKDYIVSREQPKAPTDSRLTQDNSSRKSDIDYISTLYKYDALFSREFLDNLRRKAANNARTLGEKETTSHVDALNNSRNNALALSR